MTIRTGLVILWRAEADRLNREQSKSLIFLTALRKQKICVGILYLEFSMLLFAAVRLSVTSA